MSQVNSSNVFPLAEGIYARIADSIQELVINGEGAFVSETTPITSQLLKYWFFHGYSDLRQQNFHVGQRDAILSIIYAHEVLKCTSLADLYKEIAPEAVLDEDYFAEVTNDHNKHPKYAAKMATGTGKTWVLNALLIWQYLNSSNDPTDERFSNNFLIVAPGLIVYERLLDSFQGKVLNGTRVFSTSDIFSAKDLFVPATFEQKLFGFLQGSVVTKTEIGKTVTSGGIIAITNWHLLAGDEDPDFLGEADQIIDYGIEIDEKALAEDFLPITPGTGTSNALDVLDRRFRRGEALDYLVALPRLVVFNDEAHHIHSVKKGEQTSEVEWQKSLRRIAESKQHRFIQVDFSATPYNETGSKSSRSRRYFPHIVVDFDLRSAMAQGLVKTLLLDRRQEIASLPLDFKVERDSEGNASLSQGQITMIRAGLARLDILTEAFGTVDSDKHPKMMIVVEDTTVVPLVERFLKDEGLGEDEILSVHSGKKAELGLKEWEPLREKLFALDSVSKPKVVISVLMLREGFDVNNICVIVPLRASQASILLEQTIGRGLRLMWRGDSAIDDLKTESRRLISAKREPNHYFDMLFVIEHPAFLEFYEELLAGGAGITEGELDPKSVKGDLIKIELRPGFESYDFSIPIVLRDGEEEMVQPSMDVSSLKVSKFRLDYLQTIVGQGDRFTAESIENGLRFGDYRINGGVMTATGFNDFLSRIANRIVEAHQRAFVTTNQQYNSASEFPVLKAYQRLVIGWVDQYIRTRFFGSEFNPMESENWRLLLLPGVAEEISAEVGRALIEFQDNESVTVADVIHRKTSEIDSINVRKEFSIDVSKCIFPTLPFPSNSGGLEKAFISWVDNDSKIEAILKIDEHKHTFLRRPYLRADGLPALYSPDFLVRAQGQIYLVETKSQAALVDANVVRKKRSALNWISQVNALPEDQRSGCTWHYVLAGETSVRNYISNSGSAFDYLVSASLAEVGNEDLGWLF